METSRGPQWGDIIGRSAPKAGETEVSGLADSGGTIVSTLIDQPRMRTIIGEYVRQFPETVARLQELVNGEDLRSLRDLVHQIRGTGGGYGFAALSEFAGEVENSILAADSPTSIAAKTDSLIDVMRRSQGYDQSTLTVHSLDNAA